MNQKHVSIIYLIYAEIEGIGQWKIGYTKRNPQLRLLELITANPNIKNVSAEYKVYSDIGYQIESILHRFYNKFRINGEWFKFEALTIDDFLNNCQKIDNNINILKQHSTLYDDFKH
jgi:hypothetical protein